MKTNPLSGHRIYDGCPDSTLQSLLDEIEALHAKLKSLNREAHVTYFPLEEKWQAHIWGKPLSGMMDSKKSAIEAAISALE